MTIFESGVTRDIPAFGGAAVSVFQDISFPRLFYGDPTIAPLLGNLCLSPDLTDTEIAAMGATCTNIPGQQLDGINHLNNLVAPGHSPLQPNTIITRDTVTSLTGLTPQQFVDGASVAVDQPAGFFYWGLAGNLSVGFLGAPSYRPPIAVDSKFRTPYSQAFHVGLQREITRSLAAYADYFYRDIRNILGVRLTNLAFEARMPGHAGETLPGTGDQPINTYGPWYSGNYNAVVVGLRKQMTGRFTFDVNYTFAHAIDNLLGSSLNSNVQTGLGVRLTAFGSTTDSFVGIPPVVTDPGGYQPRRHLYRADNAHGPVLARRENITTDQISIAGLPILPTLTRFRPTDSSNCRSNFKFPRFSGRKVGFIIAVRSPAMRRTWTATGSLPRTISPSAGTILLPRRL